MNSTEQTIIYRTMTTFTVDGIIIDPAEQEYEQIPFGSFLVARKLMTSEVWLDRPSSWLKIWIYIIGNVQFKPTEKLNRGQGYFNFTALCRKKAFGADVTIDHVESFLKYAKREGMLTTKRGTHGVRITVCKYDWYQNFQTYSSYVQTGDKTGTEFDTKTGTDLGSDPRLDNISKPEQKSPPQPETKPEININNIHYTGSPPLHPPFFNNLNNIRDYATAY